MRSNDPVTQAPSAPDPDGQLTLAQAQIELAVQLAGLCARPARWRGANDADAAATCAFFLISAASVAWVEAAAAHERVCAVDVSIEAMGAFAAIEASIATGRLQIVICGAGPGTLGPLWAIPGARAQGASVLVLAPRTPPHLIRANDIQESSRHQPIHTAGSQLFDEVLALESVAEMRRIAIRLRHLFARPQGAVVQLSAPTSLLAAECPSLPSLSALVIAPPAPSPSTMAHVVELLMGPGGPPAFLLGSGSVAYRDRLGALLARWGAVHFSTPAAAAILPGSLGVIGNAGSGEVGARLRELDVRCVVVLGSRLGIASGGDDGALLPRDCQIVHVDVDPDVTAGNAAATWDRPVLAVTSGIAEFLDALEPDAEPSNHVSATSSPTKE